MVFSNDFDGICWLPAAAAACWRLLAGCYLLAAGCCCCCCCCYCLLGAAGCCWLLLLYGQAWKVHDKRVCIPKATTKDTKHHLVMRSKPARGSNTHDVFLPNQKKISPMGREVSPAGCLLAACWLLAGCWLLLLLLLAGYWLLAGCLQLLACCCCLASFPHT